MAQREKEIQVPDTLAPCANNCGFPANPATNNLCQACFNASRSAPAPQPSCYGSREAPRSAPAAPPSPPPADIRAAPREDRAAAAPEEKRKAVRRCAGCGRRVGLTGFRCRCGELFCGTHRYSDRHDCPFDYKAAARATIARENPVVRAAKIVRI